MTSKEASTRALRHSVGVDCESAFVLGLLDEFFTVCDDHTPIALVELWGERFLDLRRIIDRNAFSGDYAIVEKMATLLEQWLKALREEEGDSILNQLFYEKDEKDI